MLHPVRFRQQSFISTNCVITGKLNILFHTVQRFCRIGSAPDIMQVFTGRPACQIIRDFPDLCLTHAVNQKIGAALRQNGWQQFVFPIIIMGKTPQACFNAANYDRYVRP